MRPEEGRYLAPSPQEVYHTAEVQACFGPVIIRIGSATLKGLTSLNGSRVETLMQVASPPTHL